MNLETRIDLERQIVESTVHELLSHGFLLAVYDGEEETGEMRDSADILSHLRNTDEDTLYAYNDTTMVGWVFFVYGNSGYDVINDHTVGMQQYLTKTFELVKKLEGKNV